MITDLDIDTYFEYPKQVTMEQQKQIKILGSVARAMAMAIVNNTPKCPDQTAAIRKLRESYMTAVAAIVLNP